MRSAIMVDMASVCADHALFTIDTALTQFEINVNLDGWADSPWVSRVSALPADLLGFPGCSDLARFSRPFCVTVASRIRPGIFPDIITLVQQDREYSLTSTEFRVYGEAVFRSICSGH